MQDLSEQKAGGPTMESLRLPRLFRDGMILQRDQAATLRGHSAPGATLEIRLAGYACRSVADPKGRWSAVLPALPAGGPHELLVKASNGDSLTVRDLYAGDVWLCSGQSNIMTPMERLLDTFPLDFRDTNQPLIRQFTVPEAFDFDAPREDHGGGEWEASSPRTIARFSAVSWYFAREIRQHHKVPIGLVQCAVGGSPAESWISQEGLAEFPWHLSEALRWKDKTLVRTTEAADNARNQDWHTRLDSQDRGLAEGWKDSACNDHDWARMDVPALWSPELAGTKNGVVWFRREFTVPDRLAYQAAVLNLGCIVDADTVYLNGEYAGSTGYQYPPRRYVIPAGRLKPGRNLLSVRIVNESGSGGFVPDKPCRITFGIPADCSSAALTRDDFSEVIDLSGPWKLKAGASAEPLGSSVFIRWKPSGLYNAMLAPLMQYCIKGVIWYQGESNTANSAEYPALLRSLTRDWRARWSREDLPFLLVQLPLFMSPSDSTGSSGWAALRQVQLESLAIPHTALAVTIDLGEWNDIHPVNKRDVGYRLALQARKMLYGESGLEADGPLVRSATCEGSRVMVDFTPMGPGLVAGPPVGGHTCSPGKESHTQADKDQLAGFALAGPDGVYHVAQARLVDNKVQVWSTDVAHPRHVRYAWADNPACADLWGSNGIPASPFGIPVEQQ